jgi:hypothetical protein
MKTTLMLLAFFWVAHLLQAQMPIDLSATADATYAWTTSNTGYSVVVTGTGMADTGQGSTSGSAGFTMVSLVNNSANTNLVLDETSVYGCANGLPAIGRIEFYLTNATNFPTNVATIVVPVANNTQFSSTPSTITAKCNQIGTGEIIATGARVWVGVFQPGQPALKNWGNKLIVSPGWRLDVQIYPVAGNEGLVMYAKWFEQLII